MASTMLLLLLAAVPAGAAPEDAALLQVSGGRGGSLIEEGSEADAAICPDGFPHPSPAFGNKICYTEARYASRGVGPCGSWCTHDINVGGGCGSNEGRICKLPTSTCVNDGSPSHKRKENCETYPYGEKAVNSCPAGSTPIQPAAGANVLSAVAECKKAAETFNNGYNSWLEGHCGGYPGAPTGCMTDGNTVWYCGLPNRPNTGKSFSMVCKTSSVSWHLASSSCSGGRGESCDTVCDKEGKTCDLPELKTVTTQAKMSEAASAAGKPCGGYWKGTYGAPWDGPHIDGGGTCGFMTNKDWQPSCGKTPACGWRRVCPCK